MYTWFNNTENHQNDKNVKNELFEQKRTFAYFNLKKKKYFPDNAKNDKNEILTKNDFFDRNLKFLRYIRFVYHWFNTTKNHQNVKNELFDQFYG